MSFWHSPLECANSVEAAPATTQRPNVLAPTHSN
jgi:hypothetical protein